MSAELAVNFDYTTCANCGVLFGADSIAHRRKDGARFYCPNGHPLHFGSSEADRLRKQLEAKERELARTRSDVEWQRSQRQTAERRRAAAQGQVTKIKNRVKNGVCPCCNRTFQDLQRHMSSQHPEFSA